MKGRLQEMKLRAMTGEAVGTKTQFLPDGKGGRICYRNLDRFDEPMPSDFDDEHWNSKTEKNS